MTSPPPNCTSCATTRSATRTASRCWRSSSASCGRSSFPAALDVRPRRLSSMTMTAPLTRPSRGDELELVVDSLAHGGAGVARRDGYVVFVAGAVPGDRVLAVVGKAKKAYAEARAIEILEPSP